MVLNLTEAFYLQKCLVLVVWYALMMRYTNNMNYSLTIKIINLSSQILLELIIKFNKILMSKLIVKQKRFRLSV